MASAQPNYIEEQDAVPEGPLGTAFARGVRNNVIAEIAAQGIRVGAMVVFARVLMPADLGLFYILLALSVLVALVADSGLPDAMIQRKELRAEHHATAWWISFTLSGAVAVILYAGAPSAARIMEMPRLVIGLRLLCIPLVLEGTA